MHKRDKGKEGEQLVKRHYLAQGYTLLKENFTMRGGEVDLLMKKDNLLVAIEVKYVNTIQELDNYISARKIGYLQRTLEKFLSQMYDHQFDEIRMDAVFVKNGNIIELYENITNR